MKFFKKISLFYCMLCVFTHGMAAEEYLKQLWNTAANSGLCDFGPGKKVGEMLCLQYFGGDKWNPLYIGARILKDAGILKKLPNKWDEQLRFHAPSQLIKSPVVIALAIILLYSQAQWFRTASKRREEREKKMQSWIKRHVSLAWKKLAGD